MDGSHEVGRQEQRAVDERQGAVAVAATGEPLGLVTRVYPATSDAPMFVRVDRTRRERRIAVVSAESAELHGHELHLRFDGTEVDGAPRVDAGLALDAEDRAALTAYYQDVRRGPRAGLTDGSVPLPPPGQERVIPSEGPDDAPPVRS